jgi:hypothetical protein
MRHDKSYKQWQLHKFLKSRTLLNPGLNSLILYYRNNTLCAKYWVFKVVIF